jgi:hypothetical protein
MDFDALSPRARPVPVAMIAAARSRASGVEGRAGAMARARRASRSV